MKIREEKTAYGLLMAWCLLPFVMSLYAFLTTLTGRFPPSANGNMDMNCLMAQILTYHFSFRVLGIATLIFSVFCLVWSRRQLFRKEHIRQNPCMYLLLMLLIWTVISSALSDDFSKAFWGERYRYTGLGSYFLFAGVFVCASFIHKDIYRKRILQLFCGVLTYLSLLIIIQVHADTFLDVSLPADLSCVFNQHNHFAYLLCMGIIGCVGLYLFDETAKKWMKAFYVMAEGLQLYALLLNTTFGSYLAALVALPVVFIFYARSGRKITVGSLIPAIVFLCISVLGCFPIFPVDAPLIYKIRYFLGDVKDVGTMNSNAIHAGTGRGILWKQTIERTMQRPLFGFGPDGFYGENAIISHDTVTHDSPHNEFLQMAGYTGIPSLIFYLSALITIAVHHWKTIKRLNPMLIAASGVVITYLFSSFFGNPIFYTAPYLWLFLGIITDTKENGMVFEEKKIETKARQLKYGGVLMTTLICVLCTGCLFMYSTWKSGEYIAEYADMMAMRNAELTVMTNDKRGMLSEESDYWYDVSTYHLIPAVEPCPLPYGIGTKAVGEAINVFNSSYMVEYEYDEKQDYTDKVIRVHVDGTGEDLKVDMEWVSVK